MPNWANPVEWYRDVSGVSADDAKPDARNTQNLAKGGEQPYPNLASVPSPPNNALSAADREKLRNSLSADRANAKYVDNNDQYVAAPPKNVPSPPLNAPEPPVAASSAAPPPAPVQATPAPTQSAGSPRPARGTEAPPQESSLTPPSVRSVPQGETPRSPPPPPTGAPVRAQVQQPQQTAALPPSRASAPPSDSAFDPALAGGGAALPAGVGVTLGSVVFSGTSARLSPEILAQVREVAALRQQNGGGTLRVTGYSEPQGEQDTMAPQLASFNLALDRARAVAAALTQNGIPARAVEIGATPAPPGQSGGVVEISLEQ
ncbi:MAG TPA: OmpA family protein [Stellaceae bacterium]|nr:OmpA family protein [Stellaceae bacterium]